MPLKVNVTTADGRKTSTTVADSVVDFWKAAHGQAVGKTYTSEQLQKFVNTLTPPGDQMKYSVEKAILWNALAIYKAGTDGL